MNLESNIFDKPKQLRFLTTQVKESNRHSNLE